MACCDPFEYDEEDIDGECPDCGSPTIEGTAADGCAYSPVECETCDWRPCDLSC